MVTLTHPYGMNLSAYGLNLEFVHLWILNPSTYGLYNEFVHLWQ